MRPQRRVRTAGAGHNVPHHLGSALHLRLLLCRHGGPARALLCGLRAHQAWAPALAPPANYQHLGPRPAHPVRAGSPPALGWPRIGLISLIWGCSARHNRSRGLHAPGLAQSIARAGQSYSILLGSAGNPAQSPAFAERRARPGRPHDRAAGCVGGPPIEAARGRPAGARARNGRCPHLPARRRGPGRHGRPVRRAPAGPRGRDHHPQGADHGAHLQVGLCWGLHARTTWPMISSAPALPCAGTLEATAPSGAGLPRSSAMRTTRSCARWVPAVAQPRGRALQLNPQRMQALKEEGKGRVLVVDGGGSKRCALLGDIIAEMAHKNGWSVRPAARTLPAVAHHTSETSRPRRASSSTAACGTQTPSPRCRWA